LQQLDVLLSKRGCVLVQFRWWFISAEDEVGLFGVSQKSRILQRTLIEGV
jgi:hypothetical protein